MWTLLRTFRTPSTGELAYSKLKISPTEREVDGEIVSLTLFQNGGRAKMQRVVD
jgi:hypothetical protein